MLKDRMMNEGINMKLVVALNRTC